ncbi:MAG TPA: hypothetical protein VFD57_08320 [Clostridia bacterium]|nr:hypothetical protein [Clostridia bacterium]
MENIVVAVESILHKILRPVRAQNDKRCKGLRMTESVKAWE